MAWVYYVVSGAATLLGAYGSLSQGKSDEEEANYNARVEELNAAMEGAIARREAQQIRSQGRRNLGTIDTIIGNSRLIISSASAEDIRRDTSIQLEMDAQDALHKQTIASTVGAQSAASLRASGSNRRSASRLTAAGQGLEGISKAAYFYQLSK